MEFKIQVSILLFVCLMPVRVFAQLAPTDSDNDGLSDSEETNIYHTNPQLPDTDGDGYSDGDEVKYNYDPNNNFDDKLEKKIVVALADQSLSYRLGDYIVGSFKISSGLPKTPTPPGEYKILAKKPLVNYKGIDYNYKNTRWNLLFKKGSSLGFYIHGAYWHDKFGQPMSHGCINVSYQNIEPLYNWADTGTKVIIQ
ncbi:MAG: L,D-transpeptidase family protein [Patescibacteria group bacterium]